jgi:hypothetical protein
MEDAMTPLPLRRPGRVAACAVLAALAGCLAFGARSAAAVDVTAVCSPEPADCSSWYRQPVTIDWTVLPSGSPIIAGCQDRTISIDTTGTIEFCAAGTQRDSVRREKMITVDQTPPEVTTATPDRPFDIAGWFNHPVGFAFAGTDATSGIASCDPAAYGGPDGAAVTVTGTCRDNAGNAASRAFPLRYDASAPSVAGLAAEPGDRQVRIRWKAAGDAVQTEIRRAPGLDGAAESVLYAGPPRAFRDRRVANGRRYEYTLAAVDEAGNLARHGVAATPGRRLLGPARAARLSRPPLLRWTPIRGAAFYNVQIFRAGRKLSSSWPVRPYLRLRRRWTFQGRRHRLTPGRYVWYVWPARGSRSHPRFGAVLGRRTFVITG